MSATSPLALLGSAASVVPQHSVFASGAQQIVWTTGAQQADVAAVTGVSAIALGAGAESVSSVLPATSTRLPA